MINLNTDTNNDERQLVWTMLRDVFDPEIPVLSIVDLGVVRDININTPGKQVSVTISPTYSGCPAMDAIKLGVRLKLLSHGYQEVDVASVLSPAWTTDWISEEGKRKMKEFGIAPPAIRKPGQDYFGAAEEVQCPLCNSTRTHVVSEFGSTACKALYKCDNCLEPFDVFKCH